MTDNQILTETKRKHHSFFTPWHLMPFVFMVLLVFVALLYSSGRSYEIREQQVELLGVEGYVPEFSGQRSEADILVMYNSNQKDTSARYYDTVTKVLNTIRLEYTSCDVSKDEARPGKDQLVLFCIPDLNEFDAAEFDYFAKWLKTGDIVFFCSPDFNSGFSAIYPYMGIDYVAEEEIEIDDVYFKDDILPGLKDAVIADSGLLDMTTLCQLKDSCSVSVIETSHNAPLLWDYKTDSSYVTVNNNNLLDSRNVVNGLIAHIVVKHLGTHAWPVLNSLMVFIDDFPAPQPEGFDERLKEQFGYDTQSFFMNVWWPDMKKIAEKNGILYNGVFIETYNKVKEPPFPRGYASVLLKYYGAELIDSGGEISMHGYNHESLIPEGFPNEDNYAGWSSEENMVQACEVVRKYAKGLFPEYTFTSYVPPSNYFSEEGLKALREAFPEIRVISSLYYTNTEDTAYQKEFCEDANGVINVPRVTSGFDMGPFDRLLMFNTLYEDGVASHFIHPDDVLDDERGAALGWNAMKMAFDESFAEVRRGYPMLQSMTATSCAGMVQRSQRASVTVSKESDGEKEYLDIHIDNFYDELWIALYSDEVIDDMGSGDIYRIGDNDYRIRCTAPDIRVALR